MAGRDSWSWIDDIKNISISQRTKGIILVTVPLVIILAVGLYWYISAAIFTKTMASASGISVTFTNPPSDLINPAAQIIVGLGVCMASICWGVAKIIKSLK